MSDPTIADLLQSVSDLVGKRSILYQETQTWLTGTATGGPSNDGNYPIHMSNGDPLLLASPSKLQQLLQMDKAVVLPTFASIATAQLAASVKSVRTLGYYVEGDHGGALYAVGTPTAPASPVIAIGMDGRRWELAELQPYADHAGAKANDPTFDSQPALQALCDWIDASGGGYFRLRNGATYYLGATLTCDPSRVSCYGQAAQLVWGLKNFIDPGTQPEITQHGTFDAGQTGWTVSSASSNTTLSFGTGYAQASEPTDGSPLKYASFGQILTGVQPGDVLNITVNLEYLRTATDGSNVQNYFKIIIGNRLNAQGGVNTLATMGVGDRQTQTLKSSDSTYAEPYLATFQITVPNTASWVNPYIRFDSSANFKLDSVSVKRQPDNYCLYITSSAEQYNHMKFGWNDVSIIGSLSTLPNYNAARAFATGVTLNTLQSGQTQYFSSRVTFKNVQVQGVATGIFLANGTYLCSFYSCRITGINYCVDVNPNSADAGENIHFLGCTFQAGATTTAVRNNGFSLHFFSCSMDFIAQWYTGSGTAYFIGCWDEKNANTQAGQYYIDVADRGDVYMSLCRMQVDEARPGILDAPFRVQTARSYLSLDRIIVQNFDSTLNQWAVGLGRLDLKSPKPTLAGNVPAIIQRLPERNAYVNPSIDGTSISTLAWLSSTGTGAARAQPDRNTLLWTTTGTFTGTTYLHPTSFLLGSNYITMDPAGLPVGMQAGDWITGPNIPDKTIVTYFNSTSGNVNGVPAYTAVLSQNTTDAATGQIFRWTRKTTPPGSQTIIAIDGTKMRSGTPTIRLSKGSGLGNGNPAKLSLAFRLTPGCRVGHELYFHVDPVSGGTGAPYLYFTTYWTAFGPEINGVPQVAQQLFAGGDVPMQIDSATGHLLDPDTGAVGTDDWIHYGSNTLNPTSIPAGQTGYAPDWATHLRTDISAVAWPGGRDINFADPFASVYP